MRTKTFDRLMIALLITASLPLIASLLWALRINLLYGVAAVQ